MRRRGDGVSESFFNWKGSKRRWTCSCGTTGPVFAMETIALSPSNRVEFSTSPPGTLERTAFSNRVAAYAPVSAIL